MDMDKNVATNLWQKPKIDIKAVTPGLDRMGVVNEQNISIRKEIVHELDVQAVCSPFMKCDMSCLNQKGTRVRLYTMNLARAIFSNCLHSNKCRETAAYLQNYTWAQLTNKAVIGHRVGITKLHILPVIGTRFFLVSINRGVEFQGKGGQFLQHCSLHFLVEKIVVQIWREPRFFIFGGSVDFFK